MYVQNMLQKIVYIYKYIYMYIEIQLLYLVYIFIVYDISVYEAWKIETSMGRSEGKYAGHTCISLLNWLLVGFPINPQPKRWCSWPQFEDLKFIAKSQWTCNISPWMSENLKFAKQFVKPFTNANLWFLPCIHLVVENWPVCLSHELNSRQQAGNKILFGTCLPVQTNVIYPSTGRCGIALKSKTTVSLQDSKQLKSAVILLASRKHWQLDSLKLPMASMKSGNVLSRTKGSAQISMSIGSWHSKKQTHSYTHQSLVMQGIRRIRNVIRARNSGICVLWYVCVL